MTTVTSVTESARVVIQERKNLVTVHLHWQHTFSQQVAIFLSMIYHIESSQIHIQNLLPVSSVNLLSYDQLKSSHASHLVVLVAVSMRCLLGKPLAVLVA